MHLSDSNREIPTLIFFAPKEIIFYTYPNKPFRNFPKKKILVITKERISQSKSFLYLSSKTNFLYSRKKVYFLHSASFQMCFEYGYSILHWHPMHMRTFGTCVLICVNLILLVFLLHQDKHGTEP